ncbi:MAG: hypothetical protein ABID84_03980 [Chloroflexota bacterium]
MHLFMALFYAGSVDTRWGGLLALFTEGMLALVRASAAYRNHAGEKDRWVLSSARVFRAELIWALKGGAL